MEEAESSGRKAKRRCCSCCSVILSFISLLLLVISVLLALALYFLHFLPKSQSPELCMSADCIKTAATIMSSMDTTADPCQDFYQFACGKWVENHPIPDDAASISNFENLGIQMEHILHTQLSSKEEEGEGEGVGKAKSFYQLCLNESEILRTWRPVFDQILLRHYGWPTLSANWTPPPDYSLEELYGALIAEHSVASLFKLTVQADDKDSSKYVIMLDQPDLNLHARDFYLIPEAETERESYRRMLIEVMERLGAPRSRAKAAAKAIIALETDVANATTKEEEKLDIAKLYTNLSLRNMTAMFPSIDWARLFQRVFRDIPYPPESDRAGQSREWDMDETRIVLYGTKFWTDLDRILASGKHPPRVIVDYVMWCWFYKELLKDLPDPFASILFKFYKALQVRKVPKLRWHNCVSKTNALFKWATAALYVKENFDEEAKAKVEMMIDMIMDSFHTILEEEDWLTPETKEVAADKIQAIDRKVGYPDMLKNTGEIDKLYKTYQTYVGDYFRTKFAASKADQFLELGRLGGPINRTHWVSGAAVVNAFYSPNTNEIIIPVWILFLRDSLVPTSIEFSRWAYSAPSFGQQRFPGP